MGKKLIDKPKRQPTISVRYNDQWVPFESIPEEAQQRVRQHVVEVWTTATMQQIKLIHERAKAHG